MISRFGRSCNTGCIASVVIVADTRSDVEEEVLLVAEEPECAAASPDEQHRLERCPPAVKTCQTNVTAAGDSTRFGRLNCGLVYY